MNHKTKQYDTVGEALDARRERLRTMQDAHKENAVVNNNRRYRNVRYAHLAVAKLTPEEFAAKYYKRTHRNGKTANDHHTGSWRRRFANREQRAGYTRWCKEHASGIASLDAAKSKQREFLGSCNGKKSRALRA